MNSAATENLNKIRQTLLMLSSLAERNLSMAIKALIERDSALCDAVESEDSQLDELEVVIDEMVVSHMALHAPIATDCRLMLVTSKISSNLERIGDQAVSIARRARELNKEPLLKPLIDIPRMATMTQGMLRDSITSFIDAKPEIVPDIVARDKNVDELNRQLARELTTFMMEDPKTITRAINLVITAKCIERAADHAANIAEEVYYLYQAKDIRHHKAP